MADSKRKWVFAVHKWETSDGVHHDVSFGKGSRFKTRQFRKWSDAEDFARKKAIEMKMRTYQVDTPRRPHVLVQTKEKIKIKKKPIKRGINIFSKLDF